MGISGKGPTPEGFGGKKFGMRPAPARPFPQFPATPPSQSSCPFFSGFRLPPQGPLPTGPRLLVTLPPGLPIGPLSGRGGGRRSGWLTGGAGRRRRGGQGGRGERSGKQKVSSDPAGRRGRKMAELRALVAVKRVIDFAVKVTGSPLLSLLPEPCGRVLPGSRAPTV